MIDEKDMANALDKLARRFEVAEQDWSVGRGWGQFLNAPHDHRQVGPYGTAAGVIVLSVAGRGNGKPLQDALVLLRHWWGERHTDEYALTRFAQTPRIAFLLLAMRLCGQATPTELQEIEGAILSSLLPCNRWGDYWLSKDDCDPTPRDFTSALVLTAFSLASTGNVIVPAQVTAVAEQLEQRICVAQLPSSFSGAMMALALLATKRQSISHDARKAIARLAYTGPINLARKGIYHYQCQFPRGNEHERFKNEYFISPTELVIALAGFQASAPAGLRLRAENVVTQLIENINSHDGAFVAEDDQLISTKYQAWAALLLHTARLSQSTAPRSARVWYALLRQRKDNTFTDTVLPACMLLLVGTAASLLKGQSFLSDIVLVICSTVVGGMYGPNVFRKIVNKA